VDELSFRCGQMSVRREAANVLPVIAGIRDSVVQLVSILGSVVMSVWGMGMVQGTRRLRGERERESAWACEKEVGASATARTKPVAWNDAAVYRSTLKWRTPRARPACGRLRRYQDGHHEQLRAGILFQDLMAMIQGRQKAREQQGASFLSGLEAKYADKPSKGKGKGKGKKGEEPAEPSAEEFAAARDRLQARTTKGSITKKSPSKKSTR
jgi:hypothetical protein